MDDLDSTTAVNPPDASGKQLFARQAARFSAWTPAIFILLSVVTPPLAKEPGLRMMFAWASLLLLIAGFILGIVALFGIHRHGRKGILLPAILGTVLNALFLAGGIVAILASIHARERAEEMRQRNEQLKQQMEQLQQMEQRRR